MKNRGITLIALVITIIVLLILAAVTIAMLTGDEGILNQATKAEDETRKADAKEQIKLAVMGSYNNNGKMEDDKLKENLNKIPKIEGVPEGEINYPFDVTLEGYIFTIRSNGDVELDSRPEIKIGDYIDYIPDLNEDGSKPSYSSNDLGKDKTGNELNTEDIEQETLSWQVLRKYEDGSLDIIGTPTEKKIYFSAATGYNNGVDIMNDICSKLYSKPSEGIIARSVNIEDFEYWLTSKGEKTKKSFVDGGTKYGDVKTYTVDRGYYPNLYQYEKGSGVNDTVVKSQGLGVSDSISKLTKEEQAKSSGCGYMSPALITATSTYYLLGITKENFGNGVAVLYTESVPYWIASRCVQCFDRWYGF